MKVKRKTNQLCTSRWMQRTSLFPGSSLLSLPTTWRDMWFNTNNLEVTWVTLLTGPNWTKAKQQHFSEVCSWCFYRGTQCSVDFRHMHNWILRIDCVNSLLNDLKKNNYNIWSVSPPTGQFKNYTAYQVSLFTLSNSTEVRHISSALGYSLQKGICLCVRLFSR